MTWGAKGFNARSRHFVYVGGLKYVEVSDDEGMIRTIEPADTRTEEQLDTMEVYVRYMIKRHPTIRVLGHNKVANKACPCFDMAEWCRSIGVQERNIYNG